MILVSGSTRTVGRIGPKYPGHVGHLLTPANRNSPAALPLPYAADNGCFKGFDEPRFVAFLARLAAAPRKPLWVVAPDVVADAGATLELWPHWSGEIASAGLTPCFVLQDGQENFPLPDASAYFVGGSTRFKLSHAAQQLAAEVKRRGAWLHVGRVNTLRRLKYAYEIGADSVDGSCFSRWADKFLEWALKYVGELKKQPLLFDSPN